MAIYNLTPEERKAKGLKGREWATNDEAGFTSVNIKVKEL